MNHVTAPPAAEAVPLGTQPGFGTCPSRDLWLDPITGATFAVHAGETLESALGRVRESFGDQK